MNHRDIDDLDSLDEAQAPQVPVNRRTALKRFSLLTAGGLLIAGGGAALKMSNDGWSFAEGKLVPPAPEPPADAPVFVGADNGKEYVDNTANGMMAQSTDGSDGNYFAPLPLYADEVYQGDFTPIGFNQEMADAMPAGSWIIPEVSDVAYQAIRSTFTDGRFSYIPNSFGGHISTGIRSVLSMPLGSGQGCSVLAGHVNQGDTGYLSDWGYLHRARAGMRLYIKNYDGSILEYIITFIRLLRQGGEFTNDQVLWARDGEEKANLVTCAGAYIGADGTNSAGGTMLFPYTHNLVVEARRV